MSDSIEQYAFLKTSATSWDCSVEMLTAFAKQPARLSHLMERVPAGMSSGVRRACQSRLYGTVRHIRFLEKALDSFVKKRPKPVLWASLLLASRELMESPDKCAKIVHHAVEEIGKSCSRAEKGLANAVLRKIPAKLEELARLPVARASDMAWHYSHPQWLVESWLAQFGEQETLELLRWNQSEPELFCRWQGELEELPCLKATDWDGYFSIEKKGWSRAMERVEDGRLYIQNPGARLAPYLLAERFSGGRVMDLCSAPGGKALCLESVLGERVDEIVAVDLAGPRFERMQSNFLRYGASRIRSLAGDLLVLDSGETGVFEAVLLDVPCSNTGVLQHKIDARWRMTERMLGDLTKLQLEFLEAAAGFVAKDGILVYSTCSIDERENVGVANAFLASEAGASFRLEESVVSHPWKEGHDGAGVFLMRRRR